MKLDVALAFLGEGMPGGLDLAELALLLAKDEYPELDVEAYLSELAGMAHEAGRYLRGDLRARVLLLKKRAAHAGVNDLPGQNLSVGARAARVERRVQLCLAQRRLKVSAVTSH